MVLFLVDGREGLTPQDKIIGNLLRKTGRPVQLLVNKAEGMQRARVASEFFELGLGEPIPISSAHGDNVSEVIELVFEECLKNCRNRKRLQKTSRITPSLQ